MILVTGGAGFIGSAIVWMLNRRGIEDIVIVDSLGSEDLKWKNLRGLRFQDIWKPADLLSFIGISDLPSVSAIIHMGACSSTTELDADFLLENNYRFSRTLGDWAMQHNKRFIYASSAAVYGDGSMGYSDDNALLPRLRPLNMYGYSKQLFDLHVVRNGWDQRCVGLRFFNIYGPNEYHKGPMRSMVFKAVEQIASRGDVELFKSTDQRFADGEQVRDFLYIKDAVKLVWEIFSRPELTGIYNIGSGKTSSWNSLVGAVFNALEKEPNIRYIDMPPELSERYQSYTCADMTKLQEVLRLLPAQHTMEQAVNDYVTGYVRSVPPNHLEPGIA